MRRGLRYESVLLLWQVVTAQRRVWVPETLHAPCDLLILVDQSPEPVASPNVVDLGCCVVGEGS
jgi:hypothetical protein